MPSNECHVEKIHIKDGTVNIFTRKMLNTMKLLQWCCYILVAITYGQETTTTLSEQNDYPHDNSNLSLSAQSTTHSSSATTSPRKFPEAPLTSDNWHKKSSQLMEVTRKPLKVTKPGDSTIAHVQHCVQKGLILSSKK